ncbi:MAG TPA: NUDIX hydrolase [Methylomirabilota bacterium]
MLESDARQQSAAIPYRRIDGEVEICLIRRKDTDVWGIPKGSVEEGDAPDRSALNEAREEAGLHGRIVGEPVGSYEYRKRGDVHVVAVFLMEVRKVSPDWDESWLRDRRWCSITEALTLLAAHPAAGLLRRAARRLTGAALGGRDGR